jgi:hypothetical protein
VPAGAAPSPRAADGTSGPPPSAGGAAPRRPRVPAAPGLRRGPAPAANGRTAPGPAGAARRAPRTRQRPDHDALPTAAGGHRGPPHALGQPRCGRAPARGRRGGVRYCGGGAHGRRAGRSGGTRAGHHACTGGRAEPRRLLASSISTPSHFPAGLLEGVMHSANSAVFLADGDYTNAHGVSERCQR